MKRQAKWGLLSYIVTIILFLFTAKYFFEFDRDSLITFNFSLAADEDIVGAALTGMMDLIVSILYFCWIFYLYYLFAVFLRRFLVKISNSTSKNRSRIR